MNASNPSSPAPQLGWREWLSLPELGIKHIKAKVDTGARSSALHVESMTPYVDKGAKWVRFDVQTGDLNQPLSECHAMITDQRKVTDSGGRSSQRLFIISTVQIGLLRYPIELNLTSRHTMLFPMLLGRTAIAGRFLVNASASYLQSNMPPKPIRNKHQRT